MIPSATARRDARIATFTWKPATRELQTCASLPSLLDIDLDAGDDRPLLHRILDHLHSDDVDRLQGAVDGVHAGGDAQSVELELTARDGAVRHLTATATRPPADDTDSVMGVVQDVTRFRHVECALDVRHAVTAALANWEVLGFDGLLGPLGSALRAQDVIVWASNESGLRPIATWRPDDEPGADPSGRPSDVVVRARQLGLPVAGSASGPVQHELAFPVVTLTGVLAVIEFRAPSGLWVSDTLARLLGSVGREIGAFFSARSYPADAPSLSPREREVLALVTEGLSAPEIAERLVLSPSTVRSHIRNLYAKFEVGDRVSAVVKAMRAGLIH